MRHAKVQYLHVEGEYICAPGVAALCARGHLRLDHMAVVAAPHVKVHTDVFLAAGLKVAVCVQAKRCAGRWCHIRVIEVLNLLSLQSRTFCIQLGSGCHAIDSGAFGRMDMLHVQLLQHLAECRVHADPIRTARQSYAVTFCTNHSGDGSTQNLSGIGLLAEETTSVQTHLMNTATCCGQGP